MDKKIEKVTLAHYLETDFFYCMYYGIGVLAIECVFKYVDVGTWRPYLLGITIFIMAAFVFLLASTPAEAFFNLDGEVWINRYPLHLCICFIGTVIVDAFLCSILGSGDFFILVAATLPAVILVYPPTYDVLISVLAYILLPFYLGADAIKDLLRKLR